MKRKIIAAVVMIAMVVVPMTGCGESNDNAADTVIKGEVYTADADGNTAEAVAVKDGKIVYVGDADGVSEYEGNDTEVIEDGFVMPSFIEAHGHGVEGGVAGLYEIDLNSCENYNQYLKEVKKFVNKHADQEFINGAGWINGYVPKDGPQATDLDKISKDQPIVLVSGDHHSYWTNTKAMEMAKVNKDTEDIAGGVIERDSDGNPTGCFREAAQGLIDKIIPDYTVNQYKKAILAYQNEVKEYGITAYYEPMVNLNGSKNILKAYNQLDEEGALILKVYGGYQVLPADDPDKIIDTVVAAQKEAKGGDFEITSIKLLTDGVIEGHTAYMLEDYADTPGDRGEALFEQEALNEICLKANEAGLQVHSHCIGDAATKETVNAYQYVADKTGNTDMRNAITHLQVVDEADFQRMADLNVIAVTNAYWFGKEPGYFQELEMPFLGEDRANHEYPEKSFFDAGCVVTTASDYPVTIPSRPLDAIETGVYRILYDDESTLQNPDQRVTVDQMIMASTYNAAFQNFDEENTGSLEVGKSADIIILDKNICKAKKLKINETKILKTMKAGEIIYSAE